MVWIQRSKGMVAGAIAGLLVLSGGVAWAQAPKAERPTYAVGDKWIRSDGAYGKLSFWGPPRTYGVQVGFTY